MAKDGETQYEHQSVKVIRSREAKKIAEMQNQRWELVSRTEGTLRSEMTFRRLKKTDFRPLMGLAVLALIAVFGFGLSAFLGGGDEPKPKDSTAATPNTAPEETAEEPSEVPSDEPSESATPTDEPSSDKPSESATEEPSNEPTGAPPGNAVLTMRNSADLRAMLRADDNWDLNAAFAKTYKGRQIQFDGSIADATPGYYLLYFGDNSDTEVTSGPAFQFKVRTLTVGGRPVANGDNLRFVATVDAFNVDQGLLFLTPVKITAR